MELEINKLKEVNRNNISEKSEIDVEKFMKEIEEFVSEKQRHTLNNKNNLYVIQDRTDEKLSILNIVTGEEKDVFIIKSIEDLEKINQKEIHTPIYGVTEEDFYNLDLGNNISLEGGKCKRVKQELKIENEEVLSKLEDLYFSLKEEEGKIYEVKEKRGDKIYLSGSEGGYFGIYQKAYPELNVGDTVKKNNGKYVKQ